ncbi:tyrosine-type recombinase/integrase [Psychroserpens sp. Hel_I_66]|uniref:tyrosine-type recombinase/integrase n=1 Tax=Psychroserpens sp. Hel_I_66 TaxID=1250004 RepID=UPI0006468E70|nr:site-specific integrase [Psychroserpens sp. Hel_I_66]
MKDSIHSTSGTVKFRLKDIKSKKETPIVFDYSFGRGNRLKYSTGYKTFVKNWDSSNQRIRAISTINNREEVNNKLKEIELNFIKSVSNLDELDRTNKKVLKSIYDNILGRHTQKTQEKITFFQYAENFTDSFEKNLITTNGIKLNPTTVRAYKQAIKHLKEFNKTKNYGLDFDKFDMDFYYAFISYLENKKFSINTIGKHIKNLIALLNRATEDGVNHNLKFKHRGFKRISEKSTSIYLTATEIEAIYELDLKSSPEWEKARDIFLIGYYTGQRVSDYNGMKKNQIKNFDGSDVFEINQRKTNKTVYIPIHPRIKEIMKTRYNNDLPPKMSEQVINKLLKLIGRKTKINELVLTKITKGGLVDEKMIPKYKLIGTHTARRSFCTNAYLSKMPVIDIMALSGHTTEREFYNYIKVTPQERAVKIADSAFFNN